MIDVFLKNAHSDTIRYCYWSANFLGWNYTSDKHICVPKPPKKTIEKLWEIVCLFKQILSNEVFEKYVSQIFAIKWHNFEYLTMCHHIRAYLQHPYSITDIGIGSCLRPYVVSWYPAMYHHIRAYLHHPYSITHIGIGSWLGPCVLSWWLTIISKHTSITHTQSHILVLGLGLGHVLFHDNWPCNITSSSIVHSQSYI